MTWGNPWAGLGALLVAVPVLVHLLARSRARQQPFPTLRFLAESRLQSVRRARLTDIPLLLVRCLIVLLATAALARPWFAAAGRHPPAAASARVLVVDSSASMQRLTPSGEAAVEVARRSAAEEAAPLDVVVETAYPSTLLPVAATLLRARPGEIVVFSDFQPGTLTAAEVARLPAATGVRLRRVTVESAAAASGEAVAADDDGVVRFTWDPSPSAAAGAGRVVVAGTAAESGWVTEVVASLPSLPPGRNAVLLFPDYAGRDSLLAEARPALDGWMLAAAAAMAADLGLAEAAARVDAPGGGEAAGQGGRGRAEGGVPVARGVAGEPLVQVAARDSALVIMVGDGAGELVAAAALAAGVRAMTGPVAPRELAAGHVPDSVLASWEREAAPLAAVAGAGSDGRWLWLVVLLLLGVEALMRRRSRHGEEGGHGRG
jgi:hypothetical protein